MTERQAEPATALQVLIDAKLAGGHIDPHTGSTYVFRSNEQAAQRAIEALTEAGYKILTPDAVEALDELEAHVSRSKQ